MASKFKPEQVPECVVDAYMKASQDGFKGPAERIVAALNAWPGKDMVGYGPPFYGIDLILPLPPQETRDDQRE